MDVHEYQYHMISNCKSLYFFDTTESIESYLTTSSAKVLSMLKTCIKNDEYTCVPISVNDIATVYKDSGAKDYEYFTKTIDNSKKWSKTKWKIIAITSGAERDPGVIYSIIYTKVAIDNSNIKKLEINYKITYAGINGAITIDMMSPFEDHAEETTGHMVFQLGSDGKYIRNIEVNQNLEDNRYYTDCLSSDYSIPDTKSFVSLTNAGPVYISIPSSGTLSEGTYTCNITSMTDSSIIPLTFIVEEDTDIYRMTVIDDGRGVIANTSTGIYVWKLEVSDNGKEYINQHHVLEDNYIIIIPSFIDLCPCYISIPRLDRYTPLTYTVKLWTELYNETGIFGEKAESTITNNSYNGDISYSNEISAVTFPEALSLEGGSNSTKNKYTSYYSNIKNADDLYYDGQAIVPTVMLNFLSSHIVRPDEDYDGLRLLYFNLRAIALTYIDVVNNRPESINHIIAEDCGLDIYMNNGRRFFITYYGDIYELTSDYSISNTYIYKNDNDSYKLYNMSDIYKIEDEDCYIYSGKGNIKDLKYGIKLVYEG